MNSKEIIESGIRDSNICGAVLISGDAHGIRYAEAFGEAVLGSAIPMRLNTILDVASLTKPLATTTALCICRDRGLIDFDADFRLYLPEFSANLDAPITVRDLATHVSGFGQEFEKQSPYFSEDGHQLMKNIIATSPLYRLHEKFEYSCWNFLLLGRIVEKVTGCGLSRFCQREIFEPLAMHDSSMGTPVTPDLQRLAQTPQTDRPGTISDGDARHVFEAGLSAGNAGVFSTGTDLAIFLQTILNHGKGVFSESSFREIATCREPGHYSANRTFGWIAKDEYKPDAASECAIYHSGWSGQTFLADLERQRFAIVLTVRTGDFERAKRDRAALISNLLTNE